MFITIDNRETDLLTTMNLLFQGHSHQVKLENLALGDIILYDGDEKRRSFSRENLSMTWRQV